MINRKFSKISRSTSKTFTDNNKKHFSAQSMKWKKEDKKG